MKKRFIILIISFVLVISLLVGCATKTPPEDNTNPPATDNGDTNTPPETDTGETDTDNTGTDTENPDAVSSASLATDEASFKEKISADGNWIILTDKDLSFEEDLMVEGEFEKRVLAFADYLPDNKIDKFSVTTPSLVITSANTLLEYGIVKGDVYVQAEGFTTKDATIEGNLYFATEELKTAFKMDELTKVSGEVGVKDFKK